MDELRKTFKILAGEDSSAPIMQNTQYVMAGITYGRESLNESLMGNQNSRGFWA